MKLVVQNLSKSCHLGFEKSRFPPPSFFSLGHPYILFNNNGNEIETAHKTPLEQLLDELFVNEIKMFYSHFFLNISFLYILLRFYEL